MVVPLLTAIFTLSGLAVAELFAVQVLGMGRAAFVLSVKNAIEWSDVVEGIAKSMVFSLLLVWIATYRGYHASGGAKGVGQATTQAVVAYGDVGLDDLSVVIGGQLEVLQPLYTFGKIDERQRAAEQEVSARRAQTQMTCVALCVRVAEQYEGLLLARANGARFGARAQILPCLQVRVRQPRSARLHSRSRLWAS